jgi:hypothetical protein
LLAQVNAAPAHPCSFLFHWLAFITDGFADRTPSPHEPRELMKIFCGCLVDSTWDNEIEAAVISAWLSEARTFIGPTGDDSVPVRAHFLRCDSPFPDYPGDDATE